MLLLVGILGQHHTDRAGGDGSSSVILQIPTDEIFWKAWGDFFSDVWKFRYVVPVTVICGCSKEAFRAIVQTL